MAAESREAPPAASARTRKPKGQGHERRAEILAAAKALILAEGDAGFSTRQLAARVGLSQTGLYVYFRSREEIFDALCRESFAALAAAFRAVEASIPPGRERLRALGRAYIDFGLAHPNEYRLTFMDGPGVAKHGMAGPEALFDSQGAGNQVFLMIRRNLEAARAAEGGPAAQDLTLATHTVWFALHGLVSTFIARPLFLKAEPSALIEAMLDSL